MLAFLELLGVVVGIWLLHLYFRRRAQHKFVFEGFSNEAEFLKVDQKTLNLSKLALEEMISQFHSLYNELHLYTQQPQSSPQPHNHCCFHYRDEPTELQELMLPTSDISSSKSSSVLIDIDMWISLEGILGQIAVVFKKALSEMVKHFSTTISLDLTSSTRDVVPQGMAPVIQLFDMLISPRIVKGIGYLQYQGDKIGITIEIVDLRKQGSALLHTFWAKVTADQQQSGAKDMSWLAPQYIKLFGPAMRWLVLQIWAQKVDRYFSSWVFFLGNLFHRHQQQKRRAKAAFLLGVLCFRSAEDFEDNKQFFLQLATNYLQAASQKIDSWLPKFYLGRIYYQLSQNKQTGGALIQRAIEYYTQALSVVKKKIEAPLVHKKNKRKLTILHRPKTSANRCNGGGSLENDDSGKEKNDAEAPQPSQQESLDGNDHSQESHYSSLLSAKHYIMLDRAMIIVENLYQKCWDTVKEDVRTLENEMKPQDFDPQHPFVSIRLLYNFAALYQMSYMKDIEVDNARKMARHYLIYSLARAKRSHTYSDDPWVMVNTDPHFSLMHSEEAEIEVLQELKKKLEEKLKDDLHDKSSLVYVEEDDFIKGVDSIIGEIDVKQKNVDNVMEEIDAKQKRKGGEIITIKSIVAIKSHIISIFGK